MTHYMIEITRYETVESQGRKEYQRISDTGNAADGKAVYGYVDSPNIEVKEVETVIYAQRIEDLDLIPIVAAVNEMKETS